MGLKDYVTKKAVKSAVTRHVNKRIQKIDKENKANSLTSESRGSDNKDISEEKQVYKLIATYHNGKVFSSEETYFIQDISGITHYTAKITKQGWPSDGKNIILYDIAEKEVGRSIEDNSKYIFSIYATDWGAISFEKKMGRSSKYEISEDSWGYDANPGFLKVYDAHGDAIFQIQCSLSLNSERAVIEYTDKKYEVIATLIALSMYVIQN